MLLQNLRSRILHGARLATRSLTLGVRAAAFDGEGRICLVRHTYVGGWAMPGGGVDPGESASDAALRELREEANVVATAPPRLFAVYFNPALSNRDHVLLYRCDGVRQEAPKRPDMEIAEAGFFALDALPADATPATRQRLRELAGEVAPAERW